MNYPIQGAPSPLTAGNVLRDRDGGLWIGTKAHGIVHSYKGKTILFSQAMVYQAIRWSRFSRTVKEQSGSPPPRVWSSFVSRR